MIASRSCLLLVLFLGWPVFAMAEPAEPAKPSEIRREVHPPIGVFGSRVHAKGDIMLSVRYQRLVREDFRSGDLEVSAEAVLDSGYQQVIQEMSVDRVVFEAMWVPFEEVTLVLGLPFVDNEASYLYRDGGGDLSSFDARTSGFGDVTVTLLYHVFEDERSRVHINLGLSLPSGSTAESGVSPASPTPTQLERLPYSMQLGSGTVDLQPGFTYNGYWRGLAWGAQISGTLHAGTNGEGYTLGNRYDISSWIGHRWGSWFHTGFRLNWEQWFDPNEADPLMDPTVSPSLDSNLQSGRRLDALFSIDFFITGGRFGGTRLSLEAGLPAYQFLDGPQSRTKWFLTAGLQYAF